MSGTGTRSRLARTTVVGIMVGVLVGGAVATGPVLGANEDKVTIHWFVGLGAPPEGAKARKKAINRVVKDFNKAHPDVKLVADIESDDPFDALSHLIAAGEAPDVVGPLGMRALTAFEGAFADLGPLVDAAGYDLGAYDPRLLDAYRGEGGSLIGLPFGAYPSIMYYNKDLFDEAGLAYPPASPDAPYVMPDGTEVPWDYDTVAQVAQLLTVDSKGNNATSPDFDANHIAQFGFHDQYGGFLRTATSLGGPGTLLVGDASTGTTVSIPDGWRDAMGWLQEAIWVDHIMPNSTQVASTLLGNNPFASGNVGMALAPLWYTCCIYDPQGKPRDDWDIGVVPVGLDGVTTSPLGADVISIGSTSANPEAAFAVLQYLLTDPGAGALCDVAPAATAKRPDWYARQNQLYPGVTNWAAADAMLGFPDIPSNQADLPNFAAASERVTQFYNLLMSGGEAAMDVNGALDTLEADLQAILDVQ